MSIVEQTIKKATYKVFGARPLLSAYRTKPLILMYHGVTDTPSLDLINGDGKHVHKTAFATQLKILKANFDIVPLSALVAKFHEPNPKERLMAITFDDGFRNNVTHAAPILKNLGIPATFFLSTGYIGKQRWMWTDRLENAIAQSESKFITRPGNGATLPLTTLEQKKAALRQIKAELKKKSLDTCEQQVDQIEEQLSIKNAPPHGLYRFMDWADARQLLDDGFEVGAHTINHPILSRIEIDQAEMEIADSRRHVTENTGQCSDTFCYPNGKSADYSPQVINACKKHFGAALATNKGFACKEELFELRRIGVDANISNQQLLWYMTNYATQRR
ncbi:MAG: polysaccharide deacetylase family protein [Gammaproteobacteria bacterium]|nr:polysaccharide deacetylase family protein [Gammaproteobacteria bacterium]